jgi:hypothetical protein
VKDLATTNAASEGWYKGETEYSYEKGTAKDATDVEKSAAARDFAQMVWKSTTKVGFGVKGKWVIAWYCDSAASTGSPPESVANVGQKCIADGVNTCYTTSALLAHNTRRAYHESDKLAHDAANSKKLQAAMDDSAFDGTITASLLPADCGQSIFEQGDPTKVALLATTDAATEGWYSGKANYAFDMGTYSKISLSADKKLDVDDFTRMVWKATTKVSFGIKGRFVAAWYCTVKGNMGTTDEYKKNVAKDCVKEGVDTCYVEMALRAHNEKRAKHRGGRPLQADDAASAVIQAILDKGDFTGKTSDSDKTNDFE